MGEDPGMSFGGDQRKSESVGSNPLHGGQESLTWLSGDLSCGLRRQRKRLTIPTFDMLIVNYEADPVEAAVVKRLSSRRLREGL